MESMINGLSSKYFWSSGLAALFAANVVVVIVQWACGNPREDSRTRGYSWDGPPLVAFEHSPALLLDVMPANSEIGFNSILRNHSNESVTITGISTSCGCTDVQLDVKSLSPGASATLTGKLRSQSTGGLYNVRIKVYVNGSQSTKDHVAELLVTARVVSTLKIEPASVQLQPSTDLDLASSESILMSNVTDEAKDVHLSLSEASSLQVDWVNKRILPGQSAIAVLTANANSVAENGLVNISISNTSEKHSVRYVIRPKASVEIRPASLMLGILSRTDNCWQASASCEIRILGKLSEQDITIVSQPAMLSRPSISAEKGGINLVFKISDEWDGHNPGGEIRIVSSDAWRGKSFAVTIPVVGMVEPRSKSRVRFLE